MITGLYASVFTFFLIFLVFRVVKRRWQHKVALGHGGVEELERHIRAHGNFVETVPIALFLMLIMELGAVKGEIIHAMGMTLLIGRILHLIQMTTEELPFGTFRIAGVSLTLLVLLVSAVICLLLSLSMLPMQLLAL